MDSGYWYTCCAMLIPGVLLASWIDYRQRRVPNWLNAALLAAGLTVQGLFFGWSGVGNALLGVVVGFSVLIIPWAMHGMGAGDVKLMSAIGAWFGPGLTFAAFALGAITGGVVAGIMIVASGRTTNACANLGTILVKCSSRKTMFGEFGSAKSFGATSQLLPYGVPLTVGTLVVLSGQVFQWWV